jgi:hypothetical protein
MSLWMSIVLLLALIKLPIAALMLWLPFRDDEAMNAPRVPSASDEDGGSRTLPALPPGPGPRRPGGDPRLPRGSSPVSPTPGSGASRARRDPHGAPASPAPQRVRISGPRRRRVPDELRSAPD